MVEVKHNLGVGAAKLFGILHSAFGHIAQKGGVGIVACTLGHLQDDGAFGLDCGLDDGLHLLHVIEVEGGDGVATVDCFLEHLTGVHESDFLVIYHDIVVLFVEFY